MGVRAEQETLRRLPEVSWLSQGWGRGGGCRATLERFGSSVAKAPHTSRPHPALTQAPDGLIFPDRATLYVTAIEDRQYKDYKIHCELGPKELVGWGGLDLTQAPRCAHPSSLPPPRVGECVWL